MSKMPSISKDLFIKVIEHCQLQDRHDGDITKHLNQIMPNSFVLFNTPLTDQLLGMLDDEFATDAVSWWYYEARYKDEEGRTIYGADYDYEKKRGMKWVINTPADLYDYLVETEG